MAILQGILATFDPSEAAAESPQAGDGLHAQDLRLAREALAGSPAARRQFVELMKCVPKFLAVMNARLGRPFSDDALEDIAQETLLEIWRRLGDYAGLASLNTWSYRFCQNVLSSRLPSRQHDVKNVALVQAAERTSMPTSSLDYEHVYTALEKIDEEGSRIVRYKHFEHLTFEEIGRRLGMPGSSAKASYQRSLARLREILGPLRREVGL